MTSERMISRLREGEIVYRAGYSMVHKQKELTYHDGLNGCHPEKVIWMCTHTHDLRNNGDFGPFDSKDLRQLFQINGCSLANAINSITQPRHTQISELFVEEWFAKLVGKEGYVFNNCLSHAPRFVLGQFHNRRKQAFRQQLDSNDCVKLNVCHNKTGALMKHTCVYGFQLADDVQSDLREVVLQ